jgi:polysaccharide biosynthesis protein VpsQ
VNRPTLLRLPGRAVLGLPAGAFILGFAAIVVAADRGALPNVIRRLYDWPGGDKAGHVVLLGGLAFVVDLALRGRRVGAGPRAPLLGSVLVAAAITAEEASQAFFPGRTLSLVDLACSFLGIYLGGRAATALLRRAGPPPAAERRAT